MQYPMRTFKMFRSDLYLLYFVLKKNKKANNITKKLEKHPLARLELANKDHGSHYYF